MKKIKIVYWKVRLAYRAVKKEVKLFFEYLRKYKYYRKKTLQEREAMQQMIMWQLLMNNETFQKEAGKSWMESVMKNTANPDKSAQIAHDMDIDETLRN